MVLHIFLILIGLIVIAKGGDLFVDSSVQIAKSLHVPRLIIGATIVSIATTVPEMTVSVIATFKGDPGIAIGNAVGSAIANIGLIAGVVACLTVVCVNVHDFKRRSTWMLIIAVLVVLFSIQLKVTFLYGAILFLISMGYLCFDYLSIKRKKKEKRTESQESPDAMTFNKAMVLFGIGIILVIVGSHLLVTSGMVLAVMLGVPSVVIGLSIIAIGTSLPELVTGISAARKNVPDLAIGNIVGANVLNLAFIIGLCAMIRPLEISKFTFVYSYPWLFVFIILLITGLKTTGKIGTRHGIILLVFYIFYILGLIFVPPLMSN